MRQHQRSACSPPSGVRRGDGERGSQPQHGHVAAGRARPREVRLLREGLGAVLPVPYAVVLRVGGERVAREGARRVVKDGGGRGEPLERERC